MSWKRFKFGNQKLYVIPGTDHRFRTEHDAKFYCDEHGIDFATVEKYDSKKEYARWLYLQQCERDGCISDLRRQVEYELIPAKFETIKVKEKAVKVWYVSGGQGDAHSILFTANTRKQADAYCREHRLPLRSVFCQEHIEPVYKEVCIEQNAVYTADFVYMKDGKLVVEDVKSEITRKEADYVLRRKLMLDRHGIRILET